MIHHRVTEGTEKKQKTLCSLCLCGENWFMMGVDDLKPIVEENLSAEKGGWIMTLAEKVRNEGIEQGIQQGIEQGIQQGLLEGITALIEIKFGESGLKLLPELRKITNADRLREIKDAIRVVLDVREVEKMLYH